MAARGTLAHELSDELPARASRRAALFDARDRTRFQADLTSECTRKPWMVLRAAIVGLFCRRSVLFLFHESDGK